MATRKTNFESRWGDLRMEMEKLLDEVKAKSPDAYEDAMAHFNETESFMDAVNDVLDELDQGSYDDDDDDDDE